ncbi:MAG: endolytic transglycosylase MltG [Patescibacteria group bacterium]
MKSGDNLSSLGKRLETDKVVNDAFWFEMTGKTTTQTTLQAGVYTLNLPASKENILEQIKKQQPKPLPSTTAVSFLEGDTAEDVADKLDKSGIVKAEDFLKYIQDPANFKDSKYKFLPPVSNCKYGQILQNCPKYYLEGFLFPDTYEFYLNSTPESVTEKFLSNFNQRIWGKQTTVSNADFYKNLILASVVEREVGRNYIKAMINETDLQTERQAVAGVYLNRVSQSMKWQADPTVWYGVDRKKGVAVDGALNWGDAKYKTGYNTYVITGYPVGPIANPGQKSIEAALKPTPSNYIFFVSDKSGRMYFGETYAEHEKNIAKVREINKSLPNL